MPATNTATSYGHVTKTFHWLTALLILALFPLGVIAERLPYDTADELALKAQLFSVHKTLGVTVFFVALARILWAATQVKPRLLNGDKRLESFAAELMHALLYLSLVLVPLSGWLHHAATEGFAPILWPFGQSLPLVPKSEAVAHVFGAWHFVLTKVLLAALALHVAGALKHALIDRDGTLARMWFGRAVTKTPPTVPHSATPRRVAVGLFALALAGASALGLSHAEGNAGTVPALAEVDTEWQVQEGEIAFSVMQMGSDLTGSFADWTAAIAFAETPLDGSHGSAEVTISIPSLTLGSVTSEALKPEFFAAEEFPTAVFAADIQPAETGYLATGTLTLRGQSVPVAMPFMLEIEGDTAAMSGSLSLDRRDFGIGAGYEDEATVAFGVAVEVSLTATRGAAAAE